MISSKCLQPIPARLNLICAAVNVFPQSLNVPLRNMSTPNPYLLVRCQLGLGSVLLTRPVSWGFRQNTAQKHTQSSMVLGGSTKMLSQGHGAFVSDPEVPLTQPLPSFSRIILQKNENKPFLLLLFFPSSSEGQRREPSGCQSQPNPLLPPKRAPRKP